MKVTARIPARVGLCGNPSDGYFGRAISLAISNFGAAITVEDADRITLEPSERDHSQFGSLAELVEEVRYAGYYGGLRLVKASVKRFFDYCCNKSAHLPERNFRIRYHSDVPLRVGLAGSSAIVLGALSALARFFDISIDPTHLANLALDVETQELAIPAGLQDRVAQAFGGLVYMDFAREYMEDYGYGAYEKMDERLLPPLYVAYLERVGEGTEVPHADLRRRYEEGDPRVRRVMDELADLVLEFRDALEKSDIKRLRAAMNRNFDLRASVFPISEANWQLVNTARNAGVPAKFCGSGGAIVGICENQSSLAAIESALSAVGARTITPTVGHPETTVEAE